MICGVDAGKSGAVALLDGPVAEVSDVPLLGDGSLDAHGLFTLLLGRGVVAVGVEDCFRPKSVVRFAAEVAAVAKILQVPVYTLHPAGWKRLVLGRATADKAVSVAKCRALYPLTELIPPGCRVPDHNRAEAVLIAHAVRIHRETRP